MSLSQRADKNSHTAVTRTLTLSSTITGNYNPQTFKVPVQTVFANIYSPNGIGQIVEAAHLRENKTAEVVPLVNIIGPRMFMTADPPLINKLYANRDKLEGADKTVQPKCFSSVSIVGLEPDSHEYKESKNFFRTTVFLGAPEFVPHIQKTFDFYEREWTRKGEVPNLQNWAERFALTVMMHTLLGIPIEGESEANKTKLADVVHHLVDSFTVPAKSFLIRQETLLRQKTGIKMSFTPSVDKEIKEGEQLIINMIKKHEDVVFAKLQKLAEHIPSIKEYKISKKEDLYKPEILGMIKFMLAGGFESSSKLLLAALMTAGTATLKMDGYIKTMQEEIDNCPVPPEKWTAKDIETLPYLKAFILELIRLYPPFAYQKQNAVKDFWLKDHFVPAGTNIFIDVFNAHRDESLYKNANQFDPNRWFAPENQSVSIEGAPFSNKLFTFGNIRNCQGRKMPYLELFVILGRLLAKNTVSIRVTKPVDKYKKMGIPLEKAPLEEVLLAKDLELYIEKGFTFNLLPRTVVSAQLTPRVDLQKKAGSDSQPQVRLR